jgi:hypothetical protein
MAKLENSSVQKYYNVSYSESCRHPMKFNELPDWPPRWAAIYSGSKLADGEVGTLKSFRALFSRNDSIEIIIEYKGGEHSGMLRIDPRLRDRALAILGQEKGHSMKDIGQLEFA